jgi:hypothetical protein
MRGRLDNLRTIESLDPEIGHLEIVRLMLCHEFPWDMRMAFNLAFNRTFAVAGAAELLVQTGELVERPRKRADDTGLLMYEIILNGFDDERGRTALRRINRMHHGHPIAPDDSVYTLSALIVLPVRWLNRYGWRRPSDHERVALHTFFTELGRRMNVGGLPASYDAVESWFDAYDAEHLVPSAAAEQLERATRALMVTRIPGPFKAFSDELISSLYDERLRAAVRVPPPSWLARSLLHVTLRGRALIERRLRGPRKVPLFADGIRVKSYPDGYDLTTVGAPD